MRRSTALICLLCTLPGLAYAQTPPPDPAAGDPAAAPDAQAPAAAPADAPAAAPVPSNLPPPPPRQPIPPLPPRAPGEQNAATRPLLSIGNEAYFVKPILAIAGGIMGEHSIESANKNKEDRVTTMAITRFGLEGRLGPYVSFRSEFERNIGRHGTGIWEGTASFSVRDQFIRLQRWGVTLDGGIIFDEASLDFFSAHTADLLLADRYTRDPLLYSGFNRGQGLRAAYERWGLRLGLSYTEGNPLSTSTSFQVGGAFAGGSRLWERPLGNFRIGQPDDDLHFRVLSPSLTYAHRWVELKAVAQVFWVNYQASAKEDPNLFGYTLKGNARLYGHISGKVPMTLSPFANFAIVRNEVLNNAAGYANQLLDTRFWAITAGGGMDLFILGRSGLGFSYVVVRDESPGFSTIMGMTTEPVTTTTQHYINGGLTYWVTEYVAAAARVASYRRVQDNQPDELDVSVFGTLRLVL
jgi:hypothetical protein